MSTAKIIKVDSENTFLTDIVKEFEKNIRANYSSRLHNHIGVFAEHFGKSLGKYEYTVTKVEDFSANTLFKQLNYYRDLNQKFKANYNIILEHIIRFYRWLINAYPDIDFFKDSSCMSNSVLATDSFRHTVQEGYWFAPLTPLNVPYGHDKVCFVMKNLDSVSTTFTNDTWCRVDLSALESEFYRNLILEFFSKNGTAKVLTGGYASDLRNGLITLYTAKTLKNYPTPSLDVVTPEEAVLLHNSINSYSVSNATKSNIMGRMRAFFKYCNNAGKISVDSSVFDILCTPDYPHKNRAKAISDEDITKLDEYLAEQGNDRLVYKEIRVVMHLLLQTEFRISQICHLTIDCIHPTMKPGQYEIISNSKTSCGEKERFVITSITYNLLMDIIDETDNFRQVCITESAKKYIFIYDRANNKHRNDPIILSCSVFNSTLRSICKKLGLVFTPLQIFGHIICQNHLSMFCTTGKVTLKWQY